MGCGCVFAGELRNGDAGCRGGSKKNAYHVTTGIDSALERPHNSRIFSYHPIYYWIPILFMWVLTLMVPLLLVGAEFSWLEKIFLSAVLLPLVGGLWWQRARLRKRPWMIRVATDGLVGESKSSETIRLDWQEITRIEAPPRWESFVDAMPRIVLRSGDGEKEFLIGKNVSGYKELAQIIKANTPQCSHDDL